MTALEKAPPLTEKDFQRQVVELAKILGWRVYHPFLSKWSERGFPDLTMVRPRDRRLIFAELKRDKGRLTDAQVEWQELLGALDTRGSGANWTSVEVYVWHPADWDAIQECLR